MDFQQPKGCNRDICAVWKLRPGADGPLGPIVWRMPRRVEGGRLFSLRGRQAPDRSRLRPRPLRASFRLRRRPGRL